MKEKLFTWPQLLVLSGTACAITFYVTLTLVRAPTSDGKYALIDKEATVADYVFSRPSFTEADREKTLNAINAIQDKYIRDGYIVIELTSCKPGDRCAVVDAVPTTTINITKEFRAMLGFENESPAK